MEAYLVENEEILALDNDNFTEVAALDEEIALKKGGKKDNDGRIDILCSYGAEYLSIVELKLRQINDESLKQLERYLDQRDQIVKIGEYWTNDVDPKWIGVLVGTSISPELQDKLTKGYEYGDIPIAGIILNRYRSPDQNIFVVSDTYFKYQYSSKDYSKFRYNGELYNKARLVNEVVRNYVDLNPSVTFGQLKEAFPKHIQGSFGVFDKLAVAIDLHERWGHKRHYIKPTETINLADGEIIATCNQWNPKNISKFIEQANNQGVKIELE